MANNDITYKELAKAKINLTLKILGKRHDGYHDIESLIAFATCSDTLEYRPNKPYSLETGGPYADQIHETNLITRACSALKQKVPELQLGQFHLTKNLPISSGIGGGSADAAAALRLIRKAHNLCQDDHFDWSTLAMQLGADVPVCLYQQPAVATGLGEQIYPLKHFPQLPCVLVNPNVQVPTAEVFKRLNALLGADMSEEKDNTRPIQFETPQDVIDFMRTTPNDLQNVAIAYAPSIAQVLEYLEHQTPCQIARMSGSGATCFAIYDDIDNAKNVVTQLQNDHPEWWSCNGVMG